MAPVTFPTKLIGGVTYANPLPGGKHWVKTYDLPPKDDMAAYIRLMESFETRFLHAAERGDEIHTVGDIDAFIAQKKKVYNSTRAEEHRAAGSDLCIALLEHGVANAKEHMRLRMEASPDPEKLAHLRKLVDHDLIEAQQYFRYLHRKGGKRDIDDVLAEMKGEPFNIFAGTLNPSPDSFTIFSNNRLRKAAQAMDSIDNVVAAITPVVVGHRGATELLGLFSSLSEQAKKRIELQRFDPDFEQADKQLGQTIAEVHALITRHNATPPLLPADRRKGDNTPAEKMLIEEAVALIEDIAVVRAARDKSAGLLQQKVQEHLAATRDGFAARM